MTPDDVRALRAAMGWTQKEMADRLGLSLRGYQVMERGEVPLRPVNALAVERLALAEAVSRQDIALAPAPVRRDALTLSRLIQGE